MCDNSTLGYISLFGQAVGGGLQGEAAATESQATRDAYLIQSMIDQRNADYADKRAEDALVRGNFASHQLRQDVRSTTGKYKASRGASNIAMDVGTPLAVFAGIEAVESVDQATISENTRKEEYGYRVEAANLRDSARLKRMRAGQENPALARGTSLLGTATQVAGNWYQMKEAGTFG